MAGKIVGQAIVIGNSEGGVTIAEIIGLINRYGLRLGCEPAVISKLYQKNSNVVLDAGPDNVDEYGGDFVEIEAWSNPSYLTISLDVDATVWRNPGSTASDPGGCGAFIVLSDAYSGAGPLGTTETTLAYASGTTGQTNVDGTEDIGNHSFVSCQCIYEVPAGVALKLWGVARVYTNFYILLDPIYALVDLNVLRTSR